MKNSQEQIELDFSNIKTLKGLHDLLMDKLKLPDFYGRNVNALIDCLSSLRYPEDEMIGIVLGSDEDLVVNTKSLSTLNKICLNHFLISIENVNRLEINRDRKLLIQLKGMGFGPFLSNIEY